MNIDRKLANELFAKFDKLNVNELQALYDSWDYIQLNDYDYLKIYLPQRLFTEIEKLTK